jgi:glycine/D-amino acid oxidase-like deaminating enzyme
VNNPFDVVVAGGSPAGLGAAVGAARLGVRTALLERHDILGGMGTAALVNNFCPAHLDGSRLIIGGIFAELRNRLIARRAIFASRNCAYALEPYNPGVFAEEAAALCRAAGVQVFFNARIVAAECPPHLPARIHLADGTVITARTVVDATGDAAVAAASGVQYHQGADRDHAVMPLTFCYKIGPVDHEKLRRLRLPGTDITDDATTGQVRFLISGMADLVALARARGDLTIPRDHISMIANIPGEPENATVNFGRVFIQDPTDPGQLAEAEREGRRQVEEGVRFFRKYLPGFENIQLLALARQIGVRESRQIVGLYTLTAEDVLQHRQFEDVVAQCCYAVDVHDPHGIGTKLVELPRGTHYDIPWRCLVPLTRPRNLVVAGRSISATQEAMSSFRVSPSVMAIGEAAGVTAALAAQNGADVRGVSPDRVQAQLEAAGGILH